MSSSWTELSAVLRKKGYVFVCDPYRRYATLRSLSSKKCMRTFRLGAEYDKEALQDRLLENQRDIRVTRRYFEFMRPYRVFELLPLRGNRAGRCAAVRKGVSAAPVGGVPGGLPQAGSLHR